MDLYLLAILVKKTREAQARCFMARGGNALVEAKLLEQRLDRVVEEIIENCRPSLPMMNTPPLPPA